MWRTFWTAAGVICVMLGCVVWAANNVTFLFEHPRTKGHRVVIDPKTGAAIVADAVSTTPASIPEGAQARAVVPQAEYDFGIMNPLTDGTHHFVIRNEGAAPLKLRIGPTTCKCTVSALDKGEVLPGESTAVTLQWNTGRHLQYAHSATIYTNDPHHAALDFRLQGKVRMLIGFDEAEIVLDGLPPDQPTVVERLVYSQVWDGFTIQNVEKHFEGLTWEITPADPQVVARLEAKAVQRLRITLPANLPQGRFTDILRLNVLPAGENAEVQSLDLPLSGAVPRRVAIYGQAIDVDGLIDLGDIREGKGRRVNLLVKVRDPEPALPTAMVEVFPSFVAADFKPREEGKGLYDLTIELPADAPLCQYHSTPLGHVKIDTGHPRVGVIELKMTFAVVPRQAL